MSWALIAHSAIDAPCSGIMAASEDICGHIEADEDGEGVTGLMIFPHRFIDPGFFLWQGTMEQALEGEGGVQTIVEPENLQRWIDQNGEPG